jgi:hypothetical protein
MRMAGASEKVNTKAIERRSVRFSTLSQLRAELDRIESAYRAGRLKTRGNWMPGQTLNHLATWASYAYDGHPPQLKAPWFIKLILKLQKNKFLAGPLPAGVHIPKIEGGTLGTEDVPFEQALANYRKQIQRYEVGPPPHPNVIFGPLTHEEWKLLQLRHAELHLGFLDVGA